MAAKIARATQGLGFMVKWGCDDNKVASHGPERGSLKVARIALSLPDHGKDASFFFLSSGSYSLWLRKRLTVLPGESDTKIVR